MSRVDSSPLSTYNSLMDRHLAGYFCNQRRRKHLVKSGLITKSGDVVSENTYRLNMARKEHKKHVKDLLAQAIVHKALDWERTRQVKIKQKLEEIAKIELVRRMKAECNRTGDEEVLPYLTPRDGDGSHQSRRRAKSAKGARDRGRGESGIMIDDDGCPICSREGSQSSRSQSQSGKQSGGGTSGGGSGKQNKYPKGEIDSRHLYSLDQYALYEYNLTRSDKYNEQSRTSTYLTPLITRPKSMTHQPAPPSKPRPEGARRPKTSSGDKKALHPTVPPMSHPEELRSGAEVTLKYFGEHLKLAYDPIGDPRHDVLVDQQPFGGNTLTVFKKPIMPGDTFSFISTRHRGYPFSLTFYVNGVQNARLSSCCEYKHKVGAKIGGKAGHFGLVSVTGGIGPCFKCQASGKTKQEKKTDDKDESERDDDKKAKKKSTGEKKEEEIECEVEDDEDEYDDDFEDEDEKPRGGRSRDDDDESRGGASSSGGRGNEKDTSPSRGSGRSSQRDQGRSPVGSGRSRDEARDSPVMRSTPSSPDPRHASDDEHYTIEVEQDDEPEPETAKSEKKSARSEPRSPKSEPRSPKSERRSPEPTSPEPAKSPEPEPQASEVQSPESESPESESAQKSDRGGESEPESRPYSRNTLTDLDTPRGVTSEESQDEYPQESSVETMVADKRDIEITNLALTPKQMYELAEIIKARENIVSVVLRNCALDDAGCTQICDAIRHSPSMVKLVNLSANKQLTAGCMAGVGRMLKEKKCLQVLLLHGNPIGDAGLHSLTNTLEDMFHDSARTSPHLEVARVVVQGVMSDLTAEDSDPGYQLTHLDIGDTKLTDKSVAPISRIIALDTTLTVLSLTGCKFTSDGWKTIFEALKTDTNLKKLSLDYTNLRDSLIENLCECLYSHPKLECLDLEGNGLTDRSADSITLLAESNRHIKKVKLLPGNDMSDDALDDLQDVLRRS